MGGSGRVIPEAPISIVQGLKNAGVDFSYSASDDVNAAVQAFQGADVGIVCGGTTSSESFDRKTLKVDQDSFISTVVRQSSKPVIVLLMTPGTFTADWSFQATAVLNMFLGGEQLGNAYADVLVGDVNPVGRLPVYIPMSASDATPPCPRNPCNYSEKLLVGWRGMEGKQVRWPFGHGLSYTNF